MKKIFSLFVVTVLALCATACSDDDDQQPVPPVQNHQISILSDGKEVEDNSVLKYTAEADIFGNLVAGHDAEPVFKSATPHRLEVQVTVPENDLDYIQWCGVTKECVNLDKSGVYTRAKEQVTDAAMEMHAYFKKGVQTTCRVRVDVKVNDRQERTFFIEYAN